MSKEEKQQDIIKNPARQQKQIQQPYQPEYLRLNKKPLPYDVLNGFRAPDPVIQVQKAPTQRPIAPQISFKKDFTDDVKQSLKQANAEFVSSVDGEDFDHNGEKIAIANPINNGYIDNNDEIDLGFHDRQETLPKHLWDTAEKDLPDIEKPKDIMKNQSNDIPAINEYILMILGKMIMIGKLDVIESKVQSILYGEDEEFNHQSIKLDDIVVLKRIKVQAGVFLAE